MYSLHSNYYKIVIFSGSYLDGIYTKLYYLLHYFKGIQVVEIYTENVTSSLYLNLYCHYQQSSYFVDSFVVVIKDFYCIYSRHHFKCKYPNIREARHSLYTGFEDSDW